MMNIIFYTVCFLICVVCVIVSFMRLRTPYSIIVFILITFVEIALIFSMTRDRKEEFEVIDDYECTYWYYNADGEMECDYECGIDESELETIARNIAENLKDKGCEVTEICFTPVITFKPNK